MIVHTGNLHTALGPTLTVEAQGVALIAVGRFVKTLAAVTGLKLTSTTVEVAYEQIPNVRDAQPCVLYYLVFRHDALGEIKRTVQIGPGIYHRSFTDETDKGELRTLTRLNIAEPANSPKVNFFEELDGHAEMIRFHVCQWLSFVLAEAHPAHAEMLRSQHGQLGALNNKP